MLSISVAYFLFAGISLEAGDPELTALKPQTIRAESMSFVRQSMYDRWQYYAVDRTGHFRPRVLLNFPEPYYAVNGRPYPLMSVRPLDFIPQIVD